jgi:hypothetical protein
MQLQSHRVLSPALVLAALFGCSTDDGTNPNLRPDSGHTNDGGAETASDVGADAHGMLKPFTSPGTTAPNGAILFTASGESLALGGYAFPQKNAGDPAFVDGWELKFTRVLVTVDKIRLSESPDTARSDQSQTGPLVAEADGPWAIDLHAGGALAGKGGSGEQSVPIAMLSEKNRAGGGSFDATARYAFGFDTIAATHDARNVNLDAGALAD